LVAVAALGLAVAAGCGGSSTHASTTPSPTLAVSPTPSPTATPPTPSATPTSSANATVTAGAKGATCVNGWVQPAPGSDFYRQAADALAQSQGGTGYVINAVRYFAGPLTGGGIGAIYYLDVRDPRLSARVLLVSGAGPSSAAIARTASTGWKSGDWTGFKGSQPVAAVAPLPGIPLPGKWGGPEYDPVGGVTPLLSPSVAGCLDGS
jgi:hypothetical protein